MGRKKSEFIHLDTVENGVKPTTPKKVAKKAEAVTKRLQRAQTKKSK